MSLFSNLYLGTSGLRISSNALNTTAHNITNVDTDGYTRQQVSLATSVYQTISKEHAIGYDQLGLGVTYAETRQVRDYFLDVNMRRESGRSEFYQTSVDALNQVEDILGESSGGRSFSLSMDELWISVEELLKDPCNEVNQNLLVTRSYEFITQANNVYNSLCDYQLNLNTTIRDDVNDINAWAQRIYELNIGIMKIESAQLEHANDLRDERNDLLDKLGKMGNISWKEDSDHCVNVQFEGVDLVRGDMVNKMELYQDPQTGFYSVYWKQHAEYKLNSDGDKVVVPESIPGAYVFDLSRPISSELNTDVGELKACLYARGDHNATFADLNKFPGDPEASLDYYDTTISQSVLMNVEAEFDTLIHNVTSKVNSILMDAADRATERYPASNYLRNEDGSYLQIFQTVTGDDRIYSNNPVYKDPETGKPDSLNDPDLEEYWNGFTVSNIKINMDLRQAPSLLGFRLEDGSEDNETMRLLSEAFSKEDYTLNPRVSTPVNFQTYYNAMISQVSTSGNIYTTIKDAQDQTVNSIESARQQVLGVNTDEELTFMIQFQNAYNSASRFINVVDELLEHLIQTLGM
ncbi:flagellar hook-associated protein 1 FlgK [Lachnospiraceae bacterium XBB2008]|nr:flagellar hook-associated protein 1 FlgK [Lachnospiraceae bacterium XBB2008]